MKRHALFLAGLLALAGADVSRAQPVSSSSSSVEWKAAHSKRVVRAVIDDVSAHALPDGLHREAGIRRYHTVTVKVLETLKGQPAERLQFVYSYGGVGNFKFAEAQKSGQQILLFLDDWARSRDFNRATGGYAYTRCPLAMQWLAVLTPKNVHWAHTTVPVLASNQQRLKTPEQLLGTVRAFLTTQKSHGPLRGKAVPLPAALRSGFYAVQFTIPAPMDGRQEERLSFDEFKKKYARKEPASEKLITSYERTSRGYVGVDSLELMATDCDVIVRGVVEDSCFLGAEFRPDLNIRGVRMRVLETLKGKCPETIGISMSYPRQLDELQRDRQELVVFLHNRRLELPAAALGYRTRDGLRDDAVIVLAEKKAEVLFSDLTWHRKPARILDRLRVFLREMEKPAERDTAAPFAHHGNRPIIFSFHPPQAVSAGSVIAGNSYSRASLPVNAELEANARKWATSKDPNRRWLAARAMIYFKSDRNAELLKTMVNDPAAWGRREMLRLLRLSYPYSPRLLVRWEAWHVLAGWGYEVPNPGFGRN